MMARLEFRGDPAKFLKYASAAMILGVALLVAFSWIF